MEVNGYSNSLVSLSLVEEPEVPDVGWSEELWRKRQISYPWWEMINHLSGL
jgi:hypothetical protein